MPNNAVDAIDAAIAVHVAVRDKKQEVINNARFTGEDIAQEVADIAHLNVEIQTLQNRKTHLAAAGVDVDAPSPQEIAQAQGLIKQIKGLAVQDATRSASVTFMNAALAQAKTLSSKVVA